jgi:hypothetical protein
MRKWWMRFATWSETIGAQAIFAVLFIAVLCIGWAIEHGHSVPLG